MENACAIILAAGDGKRMKSSRPKVLGEVLFRPMITWVTESCLSAGLRRGCAVLGDHAELIAEHLPSSYEHVLQTERLGTGHAASMAQNYLRDGGFSHVTVVNGDAPFISPEDLAGAYRQHIDSGYPVTMISARVDRPYGYGRVIRKGGVVTAVVEEKDADEDQRRIDEINSGAYWFKADFLLDFFRQMTNQNAQGEYYLTDAVSYAVGKGLGTGAYVADSSAVMGANSRADLAALNRAALDIVLNKHYENGVNIPFPDGIIIGPDVVIGPDTTILPGTIIKGKTDIGCDCEIGPNSYLEDAVIGDSCTILSSYVDTSTIQDKVRIGPMSNIRPGSLVKAGAKIGDFVEVKNSEIGEKTSVAHLTYVGDSDIGKRCNFGCGVVTVNYDGTKKYRTSVGDDAFIGCNTNLVAPVSVGDRVYAAAGTTITEDVPSDALVIGRARQVIKENWVQERGRYNKHKK